MSHEHDLRPAVDEDGMPILKCGTCGESYTKDGLAKSVASLYEIGCRSCCNGGFIWKVVTDGKGKFKAICARCGHVSDFGIVSEPEPKAYDVRSLL